VTLPATPLVAPSATLSATLRVTHALPGICPTGLNTSPLTLPLHLPDMASTMASIMSLTAPGIYLAPHQFGHWCCVPMHAPNQGYACVHLRLLSTFVLHAFAIAFALLLHMRVCGTTMPSSPPTAWCSRPASAWVPICTTTRGAMHTSPSACPSTYQHNVTAIGMLLRALLLR